MNPAIPSSRPESARRQRLPRRRLTAMLASFAGIAALVAAFSLGGAATAVGKTACSGAPLKIMAIGNLSVANETPVPQIVAGAKAAAARVTTTCEIGRPVQVLACDDQFDPNDAAACARAAVTDNVIAVVSFSGFDDNINPILQAAGIPSIGNNGASSTDSTSPISFPGQYSITELLGELDIVASSGAKNIVVPALGIPAISFLTGLLQAEAKSFGATVSVISVSPTATDMTSTAQQILSSGSDGVIGILATSQTVTMLEDLHQLGANFHKLRFSDDISSFTPAEVHTLGKGFSGILDGGGALSPTDTASPVIKAYFRELKAAGQNTNVLDTSDTGVTAWAAVHLIADALRGQKKFTSAVLTRRIQIPGLLDFTKYGLPPTTYGKSAFAGNATLASLRIFTKYDSAWEINSKGDLVPLLKGSDWFNVTKPLHLKL